ncbi:hypothetical protein [Massilia endophytica]|uniref:hypothetical protein n=1 Tax=Massilia endophytica TaxID=2899220 RepID=UPI001E3AB753|nr:hypothetical protein [Massilia endophytica]UGQ45361.1 hypothetical protein LSQ66_16405 [Massilia endophytica]
MSSRSPLRFPAIAGSVAGLLAAGLAVWYLYPQPEKAVPQRSAPQATAPSPVQPPAPSVLSREQATERLMALPELKAWSALIEKNSGGKVHGALIEYDPEPRAVKGKDFYQFSFIENRPEAAVRWENFLVSTTDGEILVEDAVTDELQSLDQWRDTKKPMSRRSAQ